MAKEHSIKGLPFLFFHNRFYHCSALMNLGGKIFLRSNVTIIWHTGGIFVDTTTFLEVMSVARHDFLNHLQVISGLVQLNKTERVREYINQVSVEMERLSQVSRLSVPEVAAFLMVASFLADKYQVKVIYEINTDIENCPIPGSILAEVLEEAFHQSLSCLAPPGVANRHLKITAAKSGKKFFIRIYFPEPPHDKAEIAQAKLAEVGKKMSPYGGKVGIAVSGSGGEIFIIFPHQPVDEK